MHHRPGFAHDFPALLFHTFAGFISIVHFDGNVAVGVAQIIAFGIPVVCQFQNRAFSLAAVTDESQRKPPFGIILLTQQPHPQYVLIKLKRFFQIAHPQHGVEHTHNCVSFFIRLIDKVLPIPHFKRQHCTASGYRAAINDAEMRFFQPKRLPLFGLSVIKLINIPG